MRRHSFAPRPSCRLAIAALSSTLDAPVGRLSGAVASPNFLTIPDEAAVDAMRQAALGVGGDPPIAIGETGIAAWAGFLAATRDENLRQQFGLDCNSRIVIIATEGATDREVYHNLVGTTPAAVLAGTKPQPE